MYNYEKKKLYITTSERIKNNKMFKRLMQNIFDSSEHLEEEYKKDVAEFIKKEALKYFEELSSVSMQRLFIYNDELRKYSEWYGSQNVYEELTKEEIGKFVVEADRIITRERLLKVIKSLPNPSDQFICLALFEGICGKQFSEINNLVIEDFDKENKEVLLHNANGKERKVKISLELIEIAEESSKEDTYHTYIDGMWGSQNFRSGDHHIIKATRNSYMDSDKNKATRIRNRLLRIKDYLGVNINMFGLLESGRVHMVKELMKAENTDDAQAVISVYRKVIEGRYGKIQAVGHWLEMYGKYLEG